MKVIAVATCARILITGVLALVMFSTAASAKSFNCKHFWAEMDRWSGGIG